MLDLDDSPILRRALLADAALSGITGLLLVGGGSFLAEFLTLPDPLLRYTGLALLPYAAVVAYIATRQRLSRAVVWAVVLLNVLWVLDSLVLLGSD
jgi:hypothetical protein